MGSCRVGNAICDRSFWPAQRERGALQMVKRARRQWVWWHPWGRLGLRDTSTCRTLRACTTWITHPIVDRSRRTHAHLEAYLVGYTLESAMWSYAQQCLQNTQRTRRCPRCFLLSLFATPWRRYSLSTYVLDPSRRSCSPLLWTLPLLLSLGLGCWGKLQDG